LKQLTNAAAKKAFKKQVLLSLQPAPPKLDSELPSFLRDLLSNLSSQRSMFLPVPTIIAIARFSMPAKDDTTIDFYTTEAAAYTSREQEPNYLWLDAFMAKLPKGGTVLELGCGAGQDSEVMLAKGFDVTPTDGTVEIARAAENRLGRPVAVLLFDELDARYKFDGIWANACLLHVPRTTLPSIIDRIHTALKPGGIFYASFKEGTREGRDRFDRYYNYPSVEWLREAYRSERWASIDVTKDIGDGYDNEPTPWLHMMVEKA